MLAQTRRVLPALRELYSGIIVLHSPDGGERTAELLAGSGVQVLLQRPRDTGVDTLGLARHEALRHARDAGARSIHLCDWDRVLHWVELFPDELRSIVGQIQRTDFLILGRTARAFATHPGVQRETEGIVNHVFGLAFGQLLDVTAASRGLSRRAIDALLELAAPEPTLGNDCAWPLYLSRIAGLIIGYAETEGLEWETPDRFADEIAAAGGLDAWILAHDADPRRWELRARILLQELEAINRWR